MNVAIIPARGGSRRIQRKNIRPFHGKPILAYSVEAALQSKLFDCVWVSTEDKEIGRLAERYGARWWWREPKLAEDDVGTQEIARDIVTSLQRWGEKVEYACCIYATAPLMTSKDLQLGYAAMLAGLPSTTYAYVEGWYYWGPAQAFGVVQIEGHATNRDVGVRERWIDINTEADWTRAEEMYAALKEAA